MPYMPKDTEPGRLGNSRFQDHILTLSSMIEGVPYILSDRLYNPRIAGQCTGNCNSSSHSGNSSHSASRVSYRL